MRILRGLLIALLTAFAGGILAVFVGDYLTKLAHVPEMEGQRGMTIFFLCIPLGFIVGLIIGITASVVVRRQGPAGFLIAQCSSLLVLCIVAGALGGVPYLLSDKPPKLDGRPLDLEFELRAPATLTIPAQPDGNSIQVSLYTNNKQSRFAFIDWASIRKGPQHIVIPGKVPLLTHSNNRSLLASLGNDPAAAQFIELKNLPASPRKENEAWSEWTFAMQRADLTPTSGLECFAIRYRVHPTDR